jgi:hypothetical protein
MPDGQWVRDFAGHAYPPETLPRPNGDGLVHVHAAFPSANDPFAINLALRLGDGGFGLKTIDRALMGEIPSDADPPWLLNMIPFGVLADGTVLDPSGPWYDGGRPDPNNPFDRNCTGWEYEVTFPSVAKLVGVPEEIQGHVQPGGLFHYHGRPAAALAALTRDRPHRSGPQVVGYSADGYPIIDHVMTLDDGTVARLRSGYELREGRRSFVTGTNPDYVPLGRHDGLFVQDYVYAGGVAVGTTPTIERGPRGAFVTLDRHNGVVLGDTLPAAPGYPNRHYAYVLTPEWPQIPRLFVREPDVSFREIIPFTPRGAFARWLAHIGMDVGGSRSSLYANCQGKLAVTKLPYGRPPY